MKKILIPLYILLSGLVLWGFFNPNGVRAAVANNKWSLDFVEQYYDENSTWQDLLKPPSSHPHAKLLLAREAIDSGDDNLALEYITPLVGPDNPMITNTYAEITYRQGNYTEAINAWNTAGNSGALNHITFELRDNGFLDAALLASQSAYSIDREATTAILASIYALRNELSPAIDLLNQSMQEFPYSTNYQRWLEMKSGIKLTEADSYAAQGLIKEAKLAYQESVNVNPNNWGAWKNFGRFNYNTLNDTQSAIKCFQEQIKAYAENGEGQINLARIYANEKDMESAMYWFEQAIQVKPDNKSFHLLYANYLRDSHEFPKAVIIYDRLLLNFPDDADAFYEAAIAYSQNQQPDKAIQAIEKALQLMDPPQLKYYMLAGSLYESIGNYTEALKAYENALTIDPNHSEALEAKSRLTD